MAELKNPVFILRFDGGDLKEYLSSSQFEAETAALFWQRQPSSSSSLRDCILTALEQLTVDHGLPPPSDPWVLTNVIDPALRQLRLEQSPSEETFMAEFKKLIREIISRLNERPIIVAHTVKTYDGAGARMLLSNERELKETIDLIWEEVSKQPDSVQGIKLGFGRLAASADLPGYGAVDQVDAVVDEAFGGVVDDKGALRPERFRETMTELLGNILMRLETNPISISSNSVVHDPLVSPSSLNPCNRMNSNDY